MRICTRHDFGPVKGFEFGWSPVGRPVMNVFCYLVGDTLIDTAHSNVRGSVLGMLRHEDVRRVLLTHHHEDHSGNAGAVLRERCVPAYGHEVTVRKMKDGFRIRPYQYYMWGRAARAELRVLPEAIEGEGHRLVPIHTPGHSRDHTVYLERDRGWLFSGDLFLAERIRYFRADEVVPDTVESLKKVLGLDFDTLFCGHNPQMAGGKEKLRKKLAYLEDLCGEVNRLLDRGLGEKAAIRELSSRYREVNLVRVMTLCNVSFSNAVRSIARHRDKTLKPAG